jgi:hypothetical protein
MPPRPSFVSDVLRFVVLRQKAVCFHFRSLTKICSPALIVLVKLHSSVISTYDKTLLKTRPLDHGFPLNCLSHWTAFSVGGAEVLTVMKMAVVVLGINAVWT